MPHGGGQRKEHFRTNFPTARVEEINAAIGGTGSDLGVFRLGHDVLEHKPDLLFVEFAVNDGGASPEQIHRCMEGIVRQTWKNDPTTGICFVYTLAGNMLEMLQQGRFPRSASAMEQVADRYGIPSIHMGLEVARLEKAGRLIGWPNRSGITCPRSGRRASRASRFPSGSAARPRGSTICWVRTAARSAWCWMIGLRR